MKRKRNDTIETKENLFRIILASWIAMSALVGAYMMCIFEFDDMKGGLDGSDKRSGFRHDSRESSQGSLLKPVWSHDNDSSLLRIQSTATPSTSPSLPSYESFKAACKSSFVLQ
jgi:hypothetical protein